MDETPAMTLTTQRKVLESQKLLLLSRASDPDSSCAATRYWFQSSDLRYTPTCQVYRLLANFLRRSLVPRFVSAAFFIRFSWPKNLGYHGYPLSSFFCSSSYSYYHSIILSNLYNGFETKLVKPFERELPVRRTWITSFQVVQYYRL